MLDNTLIMYGCSTSTTHLARTPADLRRRQEQAYKYRHFRKFDEDKVRLADMYVTLLTPGVETKQFGDSTRELNGFQGEEARHQVRDARIPLKGGRG